MTRVYGTVKFRIQDLLTGRTLIQSSRGRDVVAYRMANYRPGRDDWLMQYQDDRIKPFWHDVPPWVRKNWLAAWEAEQSVPPPA